MKIGYLGKQVLRMEHGIGTSRRPVPRQTDQATDRSTNRRAHREVSLPINVTVSSKSKFPIANFDIEAE